MLLTEDDGVDSAIRIIDAIDFDPDGEPELITLYLSFARGEAPEEIPLEIWLEEPSGRHPNPYRERLQFDGEEGDSAAVSVDFRLALGEPGLYWFDVYLDRQRVTRIPLTVSEAEDC